MQITIQCEGQPLVVESVDVPLPGPECSLGGVTFNAPAALYVDILAYNEQLEALAAGKLTPSAFGAARIQLIYRALRRTFPNLPEAWVRENLDVDNIESLQAAVLRQEQTPGEARAEGA